MDSTLPVACRKVSAPGYGIAELSESNIPLRVAVVIWGQAGGRCQYRGCRAVLYRDPTTKSKFNQAYLAHIYGEKGARYHPVHSPALAKDVSNIMLMCDLHHRMIDKDQVDAHPPELLQQMKREHEEMMERLHSIQDNRQSHVLIYRSPVGEHDPAVDFDIARRTMFPDRFPAHWAALELGRTVTTRTDKDAAYFKEEVEFLRLQYERQIYQPVKRGDIQHLSVFAFAPIPLLMELGKLLSDIRHADVYECQREPAGWKWQPQAAVTDFVINKPNTASTAHKDVALALSLSARITPDRINSVINGVPIWEVTHANPLPGFLRNEESLSLFRDMMRRVFEDIHVTHGTDARIHIFPAVPVSAAVEVGRVWMKKADLPLLIYDQNRATGGFRHAHTISQS
jgi:hypothetical protein